MKPDYNFRQRPEGTLVGDNQPVPDSTSWRDNGEGMNNALAGTPKSALDRGFVRSDIGSAAKSDKARYI